MPTLLFPDRDALRLALASGIVPAAVAGAPVRAGTDDYGRPLVAPQAVLSREALVGLGRLGVQALGPDAVGASSAATCWYQLLSLQALPSFPDLLEQPVLFELPASRWVPLANEIRRLGRYPFTFRWLSDPGEETPDATDPTVLVRVIAPPYFTLTRAVEAPSMCAYVEQAPRVWVAVGYQQPLVEQVVPPAGHLALIRPRHDWRFIPEVPFEAEGECLAQASIPLTFAAPALLHREGASGSIPVSLRLRTVRQTSAPELWVFYGPAWAWLESLVRRVDERTIARLSFAVGRSALDECVLVRVRPGKGVPPVLVEQAAGYAPFLKLPNLFVPAGARLEPLTRRDALRECLAPDPHRLVWLRPLHDQRFVAESLPEDVFRPLLDWVRYGAEASPRRCRGWSDSASAFALEPFVIEPDDVLATPRSPGRGDVLSEEEGPEKWPSGADASRAGLWGRAVGWVSGLVSRGSRRERGPDKQPETPAIAPAVPAAEVVRAGRRPAEDRLQRAEVVRSVEAQERCNALVSQFITKLTALSTGDRLELWPALASCYDQLDSPADAALCWLNALWEAVTPAVEWAWGWLRAEARSLRWSPHEFDLAAALDRPANPAIVRTLAAYTVWGSLQDAVPAQLRDRLGAMQAYLDAHDAKLPARAAWLAHLALCRLAGGDVLGLARARDRLLQRLLQHGLSLDLDTPAFLRFASSGLRDRYQDVRGWLTDKRELIHAWITQMGGGVRTVAGLQQFGLEPETARTRDYTDLVLAWGLARFSEHQANARLRKQAARGLTGGDPVHAFLRAAFEHRIRQVEEGTPPRGPLPSELLGQLERLTDDQRYRIEKLLEHSRILAPLERFNAYDATFRLFQGAGESERIAYSLGAIADPRDLAARIEQVLPDLRTVAPERRLQIAGRLLGNAPRAGEAVAVRVLHEITPLAEADGLPLAAQTELLEAALFAAGHFDQGPTVQRLVTYLARLFERPRQPADLAKLPEPMEQAIRSLRRLGLKAEGDRILQRVAESVLQGQPVLTARARLKGAAWPPSLRALLGVAAGWYYAGQDEAGHAVIEEARRDLYTGELAPAEKTQLALAYARTLGNVPVRLALGRFEELFQRLRGLRLASSTDTHYNLHMLRLVEMVVRAIVHEDFTLGPSVRGWLDDDEFQVRQRIHRDLKTMLGEHEVQ